MKFQILGHVFKWTMFGFEEPKTSKVNQEQTFVVANINTNITNFCSKYKTQFFNFQINTYHRLLKKQQLSNKTLPKQNVPLCMQYSPQGDD